MLGKISIAASAALLGLTMFLPSRAAADWDEYSYTSRTYETTSPDVIVRHRARMVCDADGFNCVPARESVTVREFEEAPPPPVVETYHEYLRPVPPPVSVRRTYRDY